MINAGCAARCVCFYLIVMMLASCASRGTAPVTSRQPEGAGSRVTEKAVRNTPKIPAGQDKYKRDAQGFHIVRKGDTLYSIAWNYGFDYREVAAWNSIGKPYLIYPGQVVRLKPAPVKKSPAIQPGPVVEKSPARASRKTTTQPVRPAENKPVTANKPVTRKAADRSGTISWRWPVTGKIVKSGSLTSKKGVDISGRLGQDIKAAAQGDVVYSGSGLLGYGRLIIIKHNETFLSAYAYNSELLVKEGESVSTGQTIAKMGKSSTGQALLHFEIRKNGKSVNPLKLLPKS